MGTLTIEEMAERMVDTLDPDECLELLGLDTEALVNRNMDLIEVQRQKIMEYLGETEEEGEEA